MGLNGGNVSALAIVPPLDEKPDRVPLKDVHKRGVVDPVSALLMPATSAGSLTEPANCNRTIPVFDGAARFDVVRYLLQVSTTGTGSGAVTGSPDGVNCPGPCAASLIGGSVVTLTAPLEVRTASLAT